MGVRKYEDLRLYEKKCPICGKTFVVLDAAQWAYNLSKWKKGRQVCSWHCLRAAGRDSLSMEATKSQRASEGAKKGWQNRARKEDKWATKY